MRPSPLPFHSRLAAATAAFLLLVLPVLGQEIRPEDLAEALEPIRVRREVPALAAAVVRDGRIVAAGAVGRRRTGGDEAVELDDRWHLGSITKSMTAALIAILVEREVLAWPTTIGDVFGDLEGLDPAWRPVSIEQLLSHRGGVPADLRDGGLWAELWKREGTPSEQRLRLVRGVLTRAPLSEPDAKHLYSNAGFAIAGAMAERRTGKAWEELLVEEIGRPLGLEGLGFGAPGTPGGRADEPWGHRRSGEGLVAVEPGPDADNPPAIGPAGTAHATILDLARWAAFHALEDPPDGSILEAGSIRRLHAPRAGGNYALGVVVLERGWAGGRTIFHNGSNTMWFAVMWISPAKRFAVVAASNAGGAAGESACDDAASALVGRYAK